MSKEITDTEIVNFLEDWHEIPKVHTGYGDVGFNFFDRGSDGWWINDPFVDKQGEIFDTLREAVEFAISTRLFL